MSNPSEVPVTRQALSRMGDRISFLYAERCVINRDGNSLTITDQRGVRYYAHGRPPAKSSRMAEIHAQVVSHQRKRLDVARRMYAMRFPGEDVSQLTMSQLRGREGARMKRIYAAEAERTGVYWNRRSYDPNDFDSSDPINQALTAGSAALYGVAHAVVAALGFIPALGIVHTGTDRSFVYDIADLYKAEISIPAAFDAVAAQQGNPSVEVRRFVRDKVVSRRLMPRMVQDLKALFDVPDDELVSDAELMLWSELEVIASGLNWAEEETLS